MNRYEIERASRRVAEYFSRTPFEAAVGKDQDAFDRAKLETIKVMQGILEGVKELQFTDFNAQLKRGGLMKKVETTSFFDERG